MKGWMITVLIMWQKFHPQSNLDPVPVYSPVSLIICRLSGLIDWGSCSSAVCKSISAPVSRFFTCRLWSCGCCFLHLDQATGRWSEEEGKVTRLNSEPNLVLLRRTVEIKHRTFCILYLVINSGSQTLIWRRISWSVSLFPLSDLVLKGKHFTFHPDSMSLQSLKVGSLPPKCYSTNTWFSYYALLAT